MEQFCLLNCDGHDSNVKCFEKVCHNNPDKTVHFIEFKDDRFMWNRYYDPNFHTNREFYKIEIDAAELRKYTESGKKDDIFIVSGLTKKDFVKQYNIDGREIALSEDNPDGSRPIIISNNGAEDFSKLSDDENFKNFNIHWLESEENKLFWKRSKGTTSELSRPIVSEPDKPLTHNSLYDIVKDVRATVIADLSGMGKSTTLTLLSRSYKKEKGLDWVIRVNLRDYSREIDNLPDKCDLKNVVIFFSVVDKEGLKHTFAQNLFEYRLKEKNNILLLFDGFDEIGSGQREGDKQKKITNLLKFLKNETNARIVVTTRPYEKQKTSLENELSVLSYTFKPIEKEECQKFLKNFWKRSLKLKYNENEIEESLYEKFAKVLIDKFNEAVKEEKFMGIPLSLRMLAEVYLEKFEKFCEVQQNDDLKDFNVFDLYKEFVDGKYKIYFCEKTGLSSTSANLDMLREQYEKTHKRLAFKYLFSGSTEPFKLFFSADSDESYFIKNKMPNEETTRELKRIGITQSGSKDDLDFIHRTFAEYFTSKLIYERLKQKLQNPNYSQESKDKMRTFLLDHIFIGKENAVIRSFINCELAGNSVKFENFWSGQIVPLKDQLLLAVEEGLGNVFKFLLHSEKDNGINEELISVPRNHIKELCDNGEYREANKFHDNALEYLKELGEDHLEIAIMQSYVGNAYGYLAENAKNENKNEFFNNKKKLLEMALSTFDKHLKIAEKGDATHQEDYLKQALSTFKEDFDSIKEQTTKDPDKNQRVWIKVLEIQIARVERNLANACGDLDDHLKKKELLEKALDTFKKYGEKLSIAETNRNLGNVYGELAKYAKDERKKKELFTKKKKFLKEALDTFKELGEELRIAETKRNLGNAYGKLAKFENGQEKIDSLEMRKKLIEKALPKLKVHYGLLNFKVTEAQRNLGKAYEALGKVNYPLHGAVIAGKYEEVEKLINNKVNHYTSDDLVTALHLAVREGHPDIVKLLLKKGADRNMKDVNRKTPLDLAKEQNEKLNKNRQITQKIIDILESTSNDQQQ